MNRPRLLKEIKNLQQSTEFIVYVDDRDMTRFQLLFFGPPDSVYHHGIFVFEVKIPENYPFDVPKVQFLTGRILARRMHPNLYENGKVCISLLNTWGTCEWSPLLTIEKVMLAIRALLDQNPIVHEPGIDARHPESHAYRINAAYLTLKSIRELSKVYRDHPTFGPAIEAYQTENAKDIETKCEELRAYEGQCLPTFHHARLVLEM